MPILRDYKCCQGGFFECFDDSVKCPKRADCDAMYSVMLKAPSIKSDRTKRADGALKSLAKEFQMSDIKSTREGEHQNGYLTRNNTPAPREARPGDAVIWGGAGGMNMGAALSGQIARSVRGEAVSVNPKSVGDLTGPRVASYMKDHENLKIQK